MVMALVLAVVLPGFTLVQSTTRADYYVSTDTPKLPLDVSACEKFLERTERSLGVRVPRFAYYRVASEGVVAQYTNISAVGVTYRTLRLVISSQECSRHEMAHLVINEVGRPAQFWDEGMAGFLSDECQSSLSFIKQNSRENRLTLEWATSVFSYPYGNADDMRPWYDASCAFSAYLVGDKRKNLDSMRRFLAGENFKTVFGTSTAQAWHSWLSEPQASRPSRK